MEAKWVERIEFDLLFRWFAGLGVDDPVSNAATFTKNHDRLLEGDVALKFLATVLAQPNFVAEVSKITLTLHVAQNTNGLRSVINGQIARHTGYGISLRIRKPIKEAFAWARQ